jgi:putative membrane protein
MSSTTRLIRVAALSSVGVFLLAACKGREEAADTGMAMTPPADSPAIGAGGAAGGLNDAQIAHIAVTANAIDSTAGELAKQKGSSQAVKDFAQTMITDHTGVNKQAVALATKLSVTPQDNDVSRGLQSDADRSNASLQGMSGAAFDKAYIDHEVTYHQAVLDALDRQLIPGAQNAELKALLEQVRPAVAAHLERAKQIQGQMAGTKTP